MNRQFRVVDLTYMAVCAALIAICAWITVPAAVPFTLQTFAVFCVLGLLGGRNGTISVLCYLALGGKRGTVAILVYILLGAVGLPVFSGFNGGIGALLGTTGGYILGFIFIGLIYWAAEKLFGFKLAVRIAAMIFGLLVCYAFGTAWFIQVYARKSGPIALGTALGWCVFPFIIPDLVKMALAVLLSDRLRKYLR